MTWKNWIMATTTTTWWRLKRTIVSTDKGNHKQVVLEHFNDDAFIFLVTTRPVRSVQQESNRRRFNSRSAVQTHQTQERLSQPDDNAPLRLTGIHFLVDLMYIQPCWTCASSACCATTWRGLKNDHPTTNGPIKLMNEWEVQISGLPWKSIFLSIQAAI